MFKFFKLLVLCCFICPAFLASGASIDAIESVPLAGVWKFKPDQKDAGYNEKWFSREFDDSNWENIKVPGTWNEGQKVSVEWNYEGYGWYRQKISAPASWQGGNIKLRFLAVYLISDVWLNGEYLGNHKGGYTEFSYDISNILDFSKPNENVLVVRADNTKRSYQVPGASIDWWNCGGITREVFLEKHPEIDLKKMFITTPEITEKKATVKVEVWFDNKHGSTGSLDIKAEALYHGKVISSSGFKVEPLKQNSDVYNITMNINSPKLWSPDFPYLYNLKLYWRLHKDTAGNWWTYKERFGIRKIEAKGTELFLNGKKIWLQGIAFHQDYDGMGSAVTYKAQRSDLERIKKLNANFVRLGHYPFHSYSLDVCDEIGLLVWSEIPVWQNSREELASEKMWQEWVQTQLDEMIDQKYNHPSVVFWSVANEISQTWGCQPEAPEITNYIKRATDYVRGRDSTRLVSYASAASTGGGTWQYLDVNGKPLHYGWFHSPNVYDIGPEVDKIHASQPDQPILAVELCGMSYPDNHRGYSENERFSVEYHDKLLRVDMQHLMIRKDFVCGVTLWTLADLKGGREQGTYGILDRERKQIKHIYETIKNLYSKDPKLLIIDSKTGYKPGEKLEVEIWSFNRFEKLISGCKVHWWINGKKGKAAEGEFLADISPDSAKKIGSASWSIPEDTSGFHSLLCTLEDQKGNLLFINDYYFDVGAPEKPGILWVKITDKKDKPIENANIQVQPFLGEDSPNTPNPLKKLEGFDSKDRFIRTTDVFGRVPFLLNTGKYKVKVEVKGKTVEAEAKVESGDTKEVSIQI